jgi:hypothetical protein
VCPAGKDHRKRIAPRTLSDHQIPKRTSKQVALTSLFKQTQGKQREEEGGSSTMMNDVSRLPNVLLERRRSAQILASRKPFDTVDKIESSILEKYVVWRHRVTSLGSAKGCTFPPRGLNGHNQAISIREFHLMTSLRNNFNKKRIPELTAQ